MKEKFEKISESVKSFFTRKVDLRKVFLKNFVAGIAWGIGASIGLSLIFTLSTAILRWVGGLPIVGSFLADVIEATTQALEIRRRVR